MVEFAEMMAGVMEIRRYSMEDKDLWDEFVENAKNATFLFRRDYMDYHADRFVDFSLLFFHKKKLYAVLPANRDGNTLFSHQGLTYGGLVMSCHCTTAMVVTLFEEMNNFLNSNGIERVVYKALPVDYQIIPAQEDLYALFNRCGARLTERNVSSVVDLRNPLKWYRIRQWGAQKALQTGIRVAESHDYAAFWQVLEENLMTKYGVQPVHTLQEITMLADRFPQHIRLVTALLDGEIIGGTVLYLAGRAVHVQYISANERGKRLHAIDAIFKCVLDHVDSFDFFDFGTSNENHGRMLNESLIYQKEGFGGRAICYDTYEYSLS